MVAIRHQSAAFVSNISWEKLLKNWFALKTATTVKDSGNKITWKHQFTDRLMFYYIS